MKDYVTNKEKKHIQTSIELTSESLINQLVTEILENKDVNNLNRSLYTNTLTKYVIKTFISHLKAKDTLVRNYFVENLNKNEIKECLGFIIRYNVITKDGILNVSKMERDGIDVNSYRDKPIKYTTITIQNAYKREK